MIDIILLVLKPQQSFTSLVISHFSRYDIEGMVEGEVGLEVFHLNGQYATTQWMFAAALSDIVEA